MEDGTLVISTQKTGPITGAVSSTQVVPYSQSIEIAQEDKEKFEPYTVIINTNVLNVRNGAGTNYKINTQVTKGGLYTIVEEKNGWGKLKSGAGWISLEYTKKWKKK